VVAAPVAAPAGTGQPANANPRADAGAPYKIDRAASTKMTERLIDTPRSIDSIPKEVIQDKGATSLRELARTTPGVTLGTGEGGNAFGDRIFIRGFDTRNDMYIDGVRDSGVTTRETFMVEQVDVVKGPSGSVSGRGATGGAINVVTKKPLEKNFTNISAEVGNAQQKRLTIDFNHNINEYWAVRFNGLVQDSNTPGRSSVVHDNRYGAAGAVTFKPSDAFKLTLDGYYMAFDQMPDWGVPFDARTRRPFTESGLSRNAFYGITARDFQKNAQGIVTATAEWNISPVLNVVSKLRYGHTTTDYVASKPGSPNLSNINPALWTVASTPVSRYQVNQVLANQTDAIWKFNTFGLKHTLVTGLEVSRERVEQDGYTGLTVECFPTCAGTNPLLNLWNPQGGSFPLTGTVTRNGRPTITNVKTAAAYATDTINWNDKIIANVGVRYDHYSVTRAPFTGTVLSHNEGLINWNAGLTYKILPTLAVYASYATSSNPVGAELDGGGEDYGGLTAANSVFRAEKNRLLEAGVKWELLDRKLMLSAAAFQTEKDNAREAIGGLLYDTAAYRVRGVELGVTGNVTDRLSVYGGYVHLDSEVTKSQNVANKGLPLANIAHDSFNLLAKYKLTDALTIGGQATWKGPILGGTLYASRYAAGTINVGGVNVATPAGYNKLPAGWRFDVMAEYAINKNFSVKAQVNNIFDAKLYDGFYRSGTPYVYIAPGRSATLSLNAKF
jgi:catecholate siderophore receptor